MKTRFRNWLQRASLRMYVKNGGRLADQYIPADRSVCLYAEYKCNWKDVERHTDDIKRGMVSELARKMYEENLFDVEKIRLPTGDTLCRIYIDVARRYSCHDIIQLPIRLADHSTYPKLRRDHENSQK